MKWKETITLNEQAIEKFKDKPAFKEQVDTLIENTRRIRLMSPDKLNSEIPKAKANKIIRLLRKLGIAYVEDKGRPEHEAVARQIFSDMLSRIPMSDR